IGAPQVAHLLAPARATLDPASLLVGEEEGGPYDRLARQPVPDGIEHGGSHKVTRTRCHPAKPRSPGRASNQHRIMGQRSGKSMFTLPRIAAVPTVVPTVTATGRESAEPRGGGRRAAEPRSRRTRHAPVQLGRSR